VVVNAGPNDLVASVCPVAAANLVRNAGGGFVLGPAVDQLTYIPVGSVVTEVRALNVVLYTFPGGCADGSTREVPDGGADAAAGEPAEECADGAACEGVAASLLAETLADGSASCPGWMAHPRRPKARSADPARSRR
jgi:hypothetical protein